MIEAEPAKKVIIHIGEDHRYRGKAAFMAIFEYLSRKRILTANVTRGIAGFGADHQMHTINIERLMENLPIQIEFVAPLDKVDEVMPELCEMAGTGLVEVQDTFLLVSSAPPREKSQSARKREGRGQLLRIFLGESEKWDGKPLFQAVLESMRSSDIAGVTVYRGVAGYGGTREAGEEQIHVALPDHPVTIVAIDEEDKIQSFLPFLDRMLTRGLVALSDVETVRYTHDFHATDRRSKAR
jgi:PII-like signaling protein